MVHASNLGAGAFQLTKLLFIMEFRSFTIEVLVNKHENYASCCDAFMHNEEIIYGIILTCMCMYSLPLAQCKQKFPAMEVQYQENIKQWIDDSSRKFG